MRIKTLPASIRSMPFHDRQAAMQAVVNAALHHRNICPVMEYMAGCRAPRVGVYYNPRGKYWYVSSGDDSEQYLESIAEAAIAKAEGR